MLKKYNVKTDTYDKKWVFFGTRFGSHFGFFLEPTLGPTFWCGKNNFLTGIDR